MAGFDNVRPIAWDDGTLLLLDQRRLPGSEQYLRLQTAAEVTGAIRGMAVRGAPAIGIAAAYGAVFAARDAYARAPDSWREGMEPELARLAAARPTAVNLEWALTRMRTAAAGIDGDPVAALAGQAGRIFAEDLAANHRMGALGASMLADASRVLTHCNAGALATSGYGTALGVVRAAHERGRLSTVYAGETRPWLQGARLTAWELLREGIPVNLLADSAASHAMQRGLVDWVIVGADRVAANGDVANKIGTLGLAVNANYHGVGFMVVAPTSTVDLNCESGAEIPIEERAGEELLHYAGNTVAADGAGAWNPVFDVTPAALVSVLVTEKGVLERPDEDGMRALLAVD